MRHTLAFIIAFLFFAAPPARGGAMRALDKRGSLVAINVVNDGEWRINDFLCVKTQPEKKDAKSKTPPAPPVTVVCGQVVRATRSILVVQVNLQLSKQLAHSNVALTRVNPSQRNLASLLGIHETQLRKPRDYSQASLGVLSVLSLWPFLHFEQAISDHFAVGLMPNYLSTTVGNGTLHGFGLDFTMSFYHREPFEGLWVMVGGGVDVLSVEAGGGSLTLVSPVAMGSLGWKFKSAAQVTYGASVGATYFISKTAGDFTLPGILLNFVATVGFVF